MTRPSQLSNVSSSPTDSRHPQDDNNDQELTVPAAVPSSIPSTPTASIPGSEGYPSWLPKRPPPPAPGSTLHSLSTNVMFTGDAGPTSDLPTGSAHGSEQVQATTPQTPVTPFTGGRKPTPRSVRIVSMQDSAAAESSGAARRETDQTTTRVSSFMFGLGSRIWSRAATSPPGHSPTLLSQTPVDAPHSHSHGRLRSATAAAAAAAAASAAQPKFRAPGLHLELLRDPSWKTRLHFYLFPLLVLAHVPIQTFLDFNAVFILIE